jgi:predicted ester cyclase
MNTTFGRFFSSLGRTFPAVPMVIAMSTASAASRPKHFRDHFTGRFKETQGNGRTIDFIATDIYRINAGRIAESWHLEDNLTMLQQLGQIPK